MKASVLFAIIITVRPGTPLAGRLHPNGLRDGNKGSNGDQVIVLKSHSPGPYSSRNTRTDLESLWEILNCPRSSALEVFRFNHAAVHSQRVLA